MSRGGNDDWDEDWPNQAAVWWHNAQRALTGRRGRKALAELREALLMLPERRLISGAISTAALKVKADAMPDSRLGGDGVTPLTNYAKKDALGKCEQEGIGVCAVGAYLLRKRVMETGETPEEAMRALPISADVEDYDLEETAQLGKQAGMAFSLAYILAGRNDETYGGCTPEERFAKFLAWIDAELASA